jgi:hypothetical protein
MLTAGVVMPDGTKIAVTEGTPQGGPLSQLLSNIVLERRRPLSQLHILMTAKGTRSADALCLLTIDPPAASTLPSTTKSTEAKPTTESTVEAKPRSETAMEGERARSESTLEAKATMEGKATTEAKPTSETAMEAKAASAKAAPAGADCRKAVIAGVHDTRGAAAGKRRRT